MHETARAGFGRAAAAYERSRPGYPNQAVAWLAEQLGLRHGATAVDLAAGTGKLTRSLAATGAQVIAVEPVAKMLEILRQRAPEAEPREVDQLHCRPARRPARRGDRAHPRDRGAAAVPIPLPLHHRDRVFERARAPGPRA